MKKILIFLSMVIPFFLISSTKIFAHSPYYQANVFDLSTQVVNFGDSDYYVLRSPYRDQVTSYYNEYRLNSTNNNLTYYSKDSRNILTSALSNGQYDYSLIPTLSNTRLLQFVEYKRVFYWDTFTTFLDDQLGYPISYTLDIDYTSSVPFNIIMSYSGTRWNSGWSSPSNNKIYGLKLQFFSYVNEDDDVVNYLNLYSYDVNGNGTFVWSFDYLTNDILNIGLAIKPDSTLVDTAYINGYDNGYNNGQSNGFIDGYGQGKDFGYDNGYNIGYDKGYTQGSTDNMPNFFVLMTDSLFTAVTSIGNIEILPNFKISYIAGIILALGLVKFITGRKGDE